MRPADCRFHGLHRYRLTVVEDCRHCGHRRPSSKSSRFALWAVPGGIWANALLLFALLVG